MSDRRRRQSGASRAWLVLGAVLALTLAATAAFACTGGPGHRPGALAALTASPDCTLTVPADPRTAAGLATPYVLGSAGTTCSENDEGTAAFVQATILDPATGALSVYNPVVENPGDGAVAPPVALPPGAVVTIWTGFNAGVLKLTGPGAHEFVNFAQQAYDHSPQFFRALNGAIRSGLVTVPPLTTGLDAKTCPTSRDWSVVDQDQSDNVPVAYPAYGVDNGSDEGLMGEHIYPALDCQGSSWTVPDLSAGGSTISGALQEAQAAADQAAPQALVPALDPFVTRNGQPDLYLLNLYRAQVDQPPTWDAGDTKAYCLNLANLGVPRLKSDLGPEMAAPAPDFANIAPNLAGVLQLRFEGTWATLTCTALTGLPVPY